MTTLVGTSAIVGAALASAVLLIGPRRLSTAASVTSALLLAVAVGALGWALATNDFSLVYVAESARRGAPASYRIAGLWGGMAGSLLVWSAMIGCWAAAAIRRVGGTATATVARVLGATQLVFLLPLLTVTPPFAAADAMRTDGVGLHPLLEHPAMLYHPPLLYLGLTALAPAAAAGVALMSGRGDARLRHDLRRWTWRALLLLGAGLLTGARWAYEELGWGGFWAWDPIENAALIPWLVAVAAVHARRDRITAVLVVVAALAAGAGSFLTRSGTTVSQHAFAEARDVGWFLLGGLTLAVGALVIAIRRNPGADGFRPWTSPPLVLLGGAAFVVALGTFVPAALMTAGAPPRVVEPAFFVTFAVPFLVLASAWCGREVVRAGALVAARVAHGAVAVVAVAAVGSTMGWTATASLQVGEVVVVRGHQLELIEVAARQQAGRNELTAVVALDDRTITPALRSTGAGDVTAESIVTSTVTHDVLVVPRRVDAAGFAVVDVHRKPLMAWLWVAGAVALCGMALSLSRGRRPSRPTAFSRAASRANRRAPVPPQAPAPPVPATPVPETPVAQAASRAAPSGASRDAIEG